MAGPTTNGPTPSPLTHFLRPRPETRVQTSTADTANRFTTSPMNSSLDNAARNRPGLQPNQVPAPMPTQAISLAVHIHLDAVRQRLREQHNLDLPEGSLRGPQPDWVPAPVQNPPSQALSPAARAHLDAVRHNSTFKAKDMVLIIFRHADDARAFAEKYKPRSDVHLISPTNKRYCDTRA